MGKYLCPINVLSYGRPVSNFARLWSQTRTNDRSTGKICRYSRKDVVELSSLYQVPNWLVWSHRTYSKSCHSPHSRSILDVGLYVMPRSNIMMEPCLSCHVSKDEHTSSIMISKSTNRWHGLGAHDSEEGMSISQIAKAGATDANVSLNYITTKNASPFAGHYPQLHRLVSPGPTSDFHWY